MNKLILSGRVTKDLELKYTQSNVAVCSFNLAVDRGLSREKRQEAEAQNKPTADFPRITVFGKQAENASRYLSKGSKCLIEGRIQTGSYLDNNNNRVYTTDVFAERVEYLDSQNRSQNSLQSKNYGKLYNSMPNNNNFNTGQNNDDFFSDDFTEIDDDGIIPF